MNGPQLPQTVILPSTPTISALAVRTALSASKQTISYYRRNHGFPPANCRGRVSTLSTADLAAWLYKFGTKVQWS